MPSALKDMDRAELVNLARLTHLLKGLSPAELETLEILLDEEAFETIAWSLEEIEERKGMPMAENA